VDEGQFAGGEFGLQVGECGGVALWLFTLLEQGREAGVPSRREEGAQTGHDAMNCLCSFLIVSSFPQIPTTAIGSGSGYHIE